MERNKFVKRREGNMEVTAAIKDGNGQVITDLTEKASSLNFYYYSEFSPVHRIRKYSVLTHVNPSPLVLESLEKD
jgi:hypothetical protein